MVRVACVQHDVWIMCAERVLKLDAKQPTRYTPHSPAVLLYEERTCLAVPPSEMVCNTPQGGQIGTFVVFHCVSTIIFFFLYV